MKRVKDIVDESEKMYVYILMRRKKLPKHIDKEGYLCFDEQELANYKKTKKIGRPIKI